MSQNGFPGIDRVKNATVMYLTTKGRKTGKPHRVEIWFAFANGRIYASHEGEHPDWIKNLEEKDRVQIEIGSLKCDAIATIAREDDSLQLAKRSLYEKYYRPASKETIDDWFSLSTVVEMRYDEK